MAAARPSAHSMLPWLGIAAIVVLLDQITKAMILRTMAIGDSQTITAWFNIVHWRNTGAAFSFLHASSGWQRWLFIGLAVVASCFIVWMLARHGGQRLFSWALALILGGAIGNVIDRMLHGSVVDFIQLHWRGAAFPSFNVADSAITVGAALLILDELLRVRRAK
ncbi:MAG: signal peptidase II [Pseudomonadota bacterium]